MRTIFFDVDTQLDFMYTAGALYVPGAEGIVPLLGKLTEFAKENEIQILSTADAHSEDDPEFTEWPPHCVAGTAGQQKVTATLAIAQPNVLTSHTRAQVKHGPQIIVEKQNVDCFTNPNLEPLLKHLKADRYVVYGVATEVCVRLAAFGLLKTTNARVEVVTDGIQHLRPGARDSTLEEFRVEGGILTTCDEFLASG